MVLIIALKAEEFEYMLHQEWPGNARELRNYIERLVLTEQTVMREKEEQVTDWFTLDYFIKSNMRKLSQLKDYTAITEGRYIQQMIEICNNNSTEAAKKLGIDRSVIYRKLKKMEKVLKDL
jgi:DNA-binding NtrC family response regulator